MGRQRRLGRFGGEIISKIRTTNIIFSAIFVINPRITQFFHYMKPLKNLLFLIALFFFSFNTKAVDEIVITFDQVQICAGSTISVPFTSSFPMGTTHKIQLLKNGTGVSFLESTANPILFGIPNSATYSDDYELKISTNGVESLPKTVTILNPVVIQNTIYSGFGGTLTANGCENASVFWKNTATNEIFNGNPLNTPIINEPTTYKVYCQTNTSQTSELEYNLVITQPIITITNYPNNLCAGSSYLVNISSNLPSDTGYSAYLTKPGQDDSSVGGGQLVNGQININTFYVMGTGYALKIKYLHVETTTDYNINVGNLANTTFLDDGGGILNFSRSYCTDTEAKLGAVLMLYSDGLNYEPINEVVVYQWQKNGNNIGNLQNPIQLTESGIYRVTASFAGCTNTSLSIPITFNTIEGVNISPLTQNYCEGMNVKLTPSYETNTATYQWKLNDIDIFGATEREFLANKSGKYTLQINDKTCNSISNPKPLSFSDALPTRLIADQKTLCGGVGINLSASTFDSNPLFFESNGTQMIWQKNGVDIPNLTNRGIFVFEPGIYRYKLTQGTCVSYSAEHEIVVGTKWDKPKLTPNSIENNSFCAGNYQMYWNTWGTVYKDNEILNNYTSTINATESGIYKLVRDPENSCSSESDGFEIVVGTLTPKIIANRTEICGTSDYVSLIYGNAAQFSSSFSYQWLKDGVEIPNSISNYIYVNTPGTYKVRVSNGNCTEYSNEIVVTRNDNRNFNLYSLTINEFEAKNLGCSNRLTNMFEEFFPNYEIKWFRNGVEIINTNHNSIMELYTPQGGIYTATATGFGCNASSNPFVVNSDYVLQPNLTQSITYINTSATLEATGCEGTVNWYESQSTTNSLGSGFTFITPNLNSNVSYFADCTTATCKSAREKIDVVVEPCNQMVTTKSGDWNDPTIWSCIRIPYNLESVIIGAGHSILIPANYTANVKEILNSGDLVVGTNAILHFKTN